MTRWILLASGGVCAVAAIHGWLTEDVRNAILLGILAIINLAIGLMQRKKDSAQP